MAIALDATSRSSTVFTSPIQWNHTCTGSDRVLFVTVGGPPASGGFTGVTVTYNGASLTEIGHTKTDSGTTDWWISLFAMVAPATGTHQISVACSSVANLLDCEAVSYTGVSQTGLPDGVATNNSGASAVTTITFTNTVTTSNSWQILAARNHANSAWTGGTGTTSRINGPNVYSLTFDSNGPVSSGSQSLVINGASTKVGGVIASFAPSVAASTTNPAFLLNFIN